MTALERMERQAVLLDRRDPLEDIGLLARLEREQWKTRTRELEESGEPLASFLTGTNMELIYASAAAGTAKNTFTAEVQINDTAGMGVQAHLPADFWLPTKNSIARGIRIVARGILSSTATPTYTFTVRAGAAGSTTTAILLGSAALTTGSGVTNQMWELEGDVILEAIGAAGTNSTVRGTGLLACGGLASPFSYPVWGGAASPGTVATLDTSIVNYINFNVACSASSASNTITLLQLLVFGLN
jgi:hypothetical protein